ncbi:MAG: hypothetical protein Q8880_00020 [Bacteroidota bacterium]|nr:hypothetical protein [Bacteroidota bacterium]
MKKYNYTERIFLSSIILLIIFSSFTVLTGCRKENQYERNITRAIVPEDFQKNGQLLTQKQLDSMITGSTIGNRPENAFVPVIFGKENHKLLSPEEYNSNIGENYTVFYTDLKSYFRITHEQTATADYAGIIEFMNNKPVYAYDPLSSVKNKRTDEDKQVTELIQSSPSMYLNNKDYADDNLDFYPADIIIHPNSNIWPETSSVYPEGTSFGHTAGVTAININTYKYLNYKSEVKIISHQSKSNLISRLKSNNSQTTDINSRLDNILVMEAIGSNVPPSEQVREAKASLYWSKYNVNERLRLRSKNLTKDQKLKVVKFLREQDKDTYSVLAVKEFKCKSSNSGNSSKDKCSGQDWADEDIWYCSLLLWQAYMYATDGNLDIDSNGGSLVFPNDIINSKAFDGANGSKVRF